MSKWYIGAGEQNDIVISTRIRLARNIEDYPFPCKLDTKTRTALNKKIGDAVCGRENLEFIEMKTLTQPQIVSLAEKHLISPEFASSYDGRALLLSDSEGISIMLCEEDHIKIQVMKPGLSLETAYAEADRIDDELNEKFVFAFDDRLGYLTQCPTNLGTGMRASVLLHLPALTACGQMSSISSTVSKLGLTVCGSYGEGSVPMGDIYCLSNQVTLGISEKAAIENLENITKQLVSQERQARERLAKSIDIQDSVSRSLGLLKSAMVMTHDEALKLLSNVRFGILSGQIKDVTADVVDSLMEKIEPATLMVNSGKNLSAQERDIERAKILREALS